MAAALGALAKIGGALLGAGKSALSTVALVAGFYGVVIVTLHVVTDALFRLANALIGATIDFNLNFISANFVSYGYNILLGVANMFFIVALVFIAFATMLRQEGFGYKKALPRLIVVMLLINFGFFVVRDWLITPVNTITDQIRLAANFNENTFTVSTILDPRGKLADGISDKEIGKITCPDLNNDGIPDETCPGQANEEYSKQVPGFAEKIGAFLAQTIASIIFSLISILALFAFAIMMLIRGVALSFLIILLPLAWITWAFPNLRIPGGGNPWNIWWESFIRWLLFAPFAMFFFFLAIKFTQLDAGNLISDALGQMFAVVAFMLGGLHVANKMGIAGSGYALAVANKGKVWVQGKMKTYGRKVGYATLKKTLPRERLQKLERLGTGKYGKYGLRQITAPIRAMGREAAIQTTAMTKAREAAFLERIKNLAPYQIADMYAGLSEEERAYALRHMIDKGYDWELVPQARKDIVRWAQKDKDGKSAFDKDVWGLKKAELDLIDEGISPDALAKMEEYRPALEKAVQAKKKAEEDKDEDRTKAADKEIERIKYVLQLEVEKILRKDLNVITPNGMGKLQRRTFSDSVPGKVGYQMFGDDEVGASMASMYGNAEMRYIALDRAESFRRVKGALRSDGTRNLSKTGAEGMETLQRWFIDPLADVGISRSDFHKEKAPEQIKILTDNWTTIIKAAKDKVQKEVDQKRRDLSLTNKQYKAALEAELQKVERAVPEKLVADLQQLVQSTQGAAHATLAI